MARGKTFSIEDFCKASKAAVTCAQELGDLKLLFAEDGKDAAKHPDSVRFALENLQRNVARGREVIADANEILNRTGSGPSDTVRVHRTTYDNAHDAAIRIAAMVLSMAWYIVDPESYERAHNLSREDESVLQHCLEPQFDLSRLENELERVGSFICPCIDGDFTTLTARINRERAAVVKLLRDDEMQGKATGSGKKKKTKKGGKRGRPTTAPRDDELLKESEDGKYKTQAAQAKAHGMEPSALSYALIRARANVTAEQNKLNKLNSE